MMYRSKKLRVAAAVAVCTAGLAVTSTPFSNTSSERSLFVAASEPVAGGPAELYLYPKEEDVKPKEAKKRGMKKQEKTKDGVKIKVKLAKQDKRLRKQRTTDSVIDEDGLSPREIRRVRMQRVLNIFSMLAEAILTFTECFGENGAFRKLRAAFGPQTSRGVFRTAGDADSDTDMEAELIQGPGSINCALSAVMKAASVFEGDAGRPKTPELEAAASAASNSLSYFVADSKVLVDQAAELATWVASKTEEVTNELNALRARDADADEDELETIVAIRDNFEGRGPSPFTVMTPDSATAKAFEFPAEEKTA